jgi:hypothetical protein
MSTEPMLGTSADQKEGRKVHDTRCFNYRVGMTVLTLVNMFSNVLGVALIAYFRQDGWWIGVVYIALGCSVFGFFRWATLGDAMDLPLIQRRLCFMTYVQLGLVFLATVLFVATPRKEFGLCCPYSTVDGLDVCCQAAQTASHVWGWGCFILLSAGLLPAAISVHTWSATQQIIKFSKADLASDD